MSAVGLSGLGWFKARLENSCAALPIDLFSSRAHNTDGDDLLDADELAAVLDHTELKIPRG